MKKIIYTLVTLIIVACSNNNNTINSVELDDTLSHSNQTNLTTTNTLTVNGLNDWFGQYGKNKLNVIDSNMSVSINSSITESTNINPNTFVSLTLLNKDIYLSGSSVGNLSKIILGLRFGNVSYPTNIKSIYLDELVADTYDIDNELYTYKGILVSSTGDGHTVNVKTSNVIVIFNAHNKNNQVIINSINITVDKCPSNINNNICNVHDSNIIINIKFIN